jgi:hypothetical protein
MGKLNLFFLTSVLILMVTGCQTIKEKTDSIVEKENEKLSKYISKPASVLQMDLGNQMKISKTQKEILSLSIILKNMEYLVREGLKLIPKIL